jgi:SAM-dependent methyltransferase
MTGLVTRLRAKADVTPVVDFNARNREAWVAAMAASLPPGARVLDLGAGTCQYRKYFGHCVYTSQDFAAYEGTSSGLMRDEFAYGHIDIVSDAAEIPVGEGSFEAVLCTEVLEHVYEPIRVVQEAARVLAPGGHLFLSAPLGSGLHQEPHHYYGGYTPHFYRRVLGDLGFDDVIIEPNGGFFRHLVQELHRAGMILHARRWRPAWHPEQLFWRVVVLQFGVRRLARLDDEVDVPEFTVGYHVRARKLA